MINKPFLLRLDFIFKLSYINSMLSRLIRLVTFTLALASASVSATPASALELVFFWRPGCVYCLRFEKDVAPIYEKSEEGRRAPLRAFDLSKGAPPYALTTPVRYTPTFVLVDKGAEIGRITGFINDDMFWGVLGKMLKDASASTAMAPVAPGEKQ